MSLHATPLPCWVCGAARTRDGVLLQLAALALVAEAQRLVDGLNVPLGLLREQIVQSPLSNTTPPCTCNK